MTLYLQVSCPIEMDNKQLQMSLYELLAFGPDVFKHLRASAH